MRGGKRITAWFENGQIVDAKARDTAVEPEAEDLVEGVAHLVVEPVEVRLLDMEGVEVPTAVALRPRRTAEHARVLARLVRPDVPIALRRIREPRMLVARVPGNEVEDDLDPELVCRIDQTVDVGERAEVGMHV